MKVKRNYYHVLKVQPDAPVEIIRASYRTLMRELKNHPDLGGSTSNASLLNEAYETLSDPGRRAAYDKKIKAARLKRTASASQTASGPAGAVRCPFCKKSLAPEAETGGVCPKCKVPLPFHRKPDRDLEKRRTIARMKKNDPIIYSNAWPEIPKNGTMIDLSPKGMRFLCSEKLDNGTVLKITTPKLKACGVVTNQRLTGGKADTAYAIGISFIAVIFEEARGAFLSVSA